MDFQVQKVFQTKPDKKVPTHGPGTSAFYRGKACKVLSIANGKAKIFASTPCSLAAASILVTNKLVDIPAEHTNKIVFIFFTPFLVIY